MTIANKLFKAINELKLATPKKEDSDFRTLCIQVEPKYKNVITFLLKCSLRSLKFPFCQVETEIQQGPFEYQVGGSSTEIQIFIPLYRFKKYGVEVSSFFHQLLKSARDLISELSNNWVFHRDYVLKTTTGEDYPRTVYKNSEIAGTTRSFLLTEAAKVMQIDDISFSSWVPGSRWLIADEIYLTGDSKSVNRFIELSAIEFSMPLQSEVKSILSSTSVMQDSTSISVSVENVNGEGNIVVQASGATNSVSTQAKNVVTKGTLFVKASNTGCAGSNGAVFASSTNIKVDGGSTTAASCLDTESTEKLLKREKVIEKTSHAGLFSSTPSINHLNDNSNQSSSLGASSSSSLESR